MIKKDLDSLSVQKPDSQNCSVCKELLTHIRQFFDMHETSYTPLTSDWLTVDDIAKELKISKSIVYRLIHHGKIEAVNIVDSNSRIPQRGHFRIHKTSLKRFLQSTKVTPLPDKTSPKNHSPRFPKIKNYLGL